MINILANDGISESAIELLREKGFNVTNEHINQDSLAESINKNNYETFLNEFKKNYGEYGDQLSFLSYDLIGLVYFLILENDFKISKKIFYKKNKFKGKIGIFEINKNVITHQLNFYSVEDNQFKKIF